MQRLQHMFEADKTFKTCLAKTHEKHLKTIVKHTQHLDKHTYNISEKHVQQPNKHISTYV
jgi:hypothetical protein